MLIAGGGVIGLSLALELSGRGLDVTVLEQGRAMRESSWAAAGMLAAGDPENPPALAGLSALSLQLYPAWRARISRLSGHPIPLRTAHTLQLCSAHDTQAAADPRRISIEAACTLVPGLAPELEAIPLWLEEGSLDPRDLCKALPAAVRAAGVQLLEHTPLAGFRSDPERAIARTADGEASADALVLCCGAWTSTVLAKSYPGATPLSGSGVPRKGQALSVRLDPAYTPQLEHVLRSPAVYLVPRGEGRIVIGATVEDAGFDRTIRPDATEWLLREAARLWPPVQNATIHEVWTGIRPGSADELPLLGPLPYQPHAARIWVTAGHYRNGILLAPATAQLLAGSMLGGAPAVDLTAFSPERFTPLLHATA